MRSFRYMRKELYDLIMSDKANQDPVVRNIVRAELW